MSNAKSITEALVIVDMQDDFLDSALSENDNAFATKCYQKLLKGILREVKKAKSKRLPIICLQYANQEDGFDSPKESWEYHATDAAIRKALKGYSRAFYAWKDDDDGSEMVMDVLNGVEPRQGLDKPSYRGKTNPLRKFITNKNKKIKFTVCGVNADACVLSTCWGLIGYEHECVVPADAAMNVWDCVFADKADEIPYQDSIKIVKTREPKLKKLAA